MSTGVFKILIAKYLIWGISNRFQLLSPTQGQILYTLLTRPPLSTHRSEILVRLACMKHAASVRPEPGSNSPLSEIFFLTTLSCLDSFRFAWLSPLRCLSSFFKLTGIYSSSLFLLFCFQSSNIFWIQLARSFFLLRCPSFPLYYIKGFSLSREGKTSFSVAPQHTHLTRH